MPISAPVLDKRFNQKMPNGATVVTPTDLVLKVADEDKKSLTPYDQIYAIVQLRSSGSGVYKDLGPDEDPAVIDEPGDVIPASTLKKLKGLDIEVKLVIGGERETPIESEPRRLHVK